MPGIKQMLHERYLSHGARPDKSMKITDLKANPELSGEKPPVPIKVKRPRSLGDVSVALESQRVYNPGLPSMPSPQPAPANTFQKGTTPAMDNTGAWGKPAEKGER